MTCILALETATDACSVALYRNGDIQERFEPGARRQTERILPLVDELLAEAGVTLAAVDALAFGHGPGAFTGVRVATSVVQGLAFARDLPVAGVSTLAACALAAFDRYPHRSRVLAAFDASSIWVRINAARTAWCRCSPMACSTRTRCRNWTVTTGCWPAPAPSIANRSRPACGWRRWTPRWRPAPAPWPVWHCRWWSRAAPCRRNRRNRFICATVS